VGGASVTPLILLFLFFYFSFFSNLYPAAKNFSATKPKQAGKNGGGLRGRKFFARLLCRAKRGMGW